MTIDLHAYCNNMIIPKGFVISSSCSRVYDIILTSGGLRDEGEKMVFFDTIGEAIRKYLPLLEGFIEQIEPKRENEILTWLWRELPHIYTAVIDGKERYTVYSRIQYYYSKKGQ